MFVPSSEKLIGVKGEYGVYHVNQKEKRRRKSKDNGL
jgi:hypothetical protein